MERKVESSAEFMANLNPDCLAAVEAGRARIVTKFNNYAVVDAEDEKLFYVLPLLYTTWGFAIVIPGKEGKPNLTTNFAEIVSRQRGKVGYRNKCRYDLRRSNVDITPWDRKR